MQSSTRTLQGALLQTVELLKLPLEIKSHSTLNEKLNIHNDIVLSDTDMPSVKYVTIGNGGHKMVMGTNNISKPEPIQHTPRHCGLYNHLPFVLRLPNNDLTPSQRLNYRLRRIETHDNISYVAYYLKLLDLSETVPQLELRSVTDGVITSTTFSPSIADLNPTPPPLNPGGIITTTGDYVAATAKVPFSMNSDDIAEFLNVANIIYGDVNYAMISEIGLCSGIDKVVTGNFNGLDSSYTDAIGVQITNFISSFFAANFSNGSINVILDIGNVEPLLTLS